jgi:hypothetical protein
MIRIETTNRVIGWGYIVATVFALFAGLFLAWLEWSFLRSWSNVGSMYGPPIGSAIGVIGLLTALLVIPRYKNYSLQLGTYVSGIIVLMAFWFLIEITPIAQGNNDSGEVFWFIVLPTIWLLTHTFRSYSRLKSASVKVA